MGKRIEVRTGRAARESRGEWVALEAAGLPSHWRARILRARRGGSRGETVHYGPYAYQWREVQTEARKGA